MKKFIDKVWKDPVWSKLIAVGLITVIPSVWAAVKTIVNELDFWGNLKLFFFTQVYLGHVTLVLVGIFLVWILLSVILKRTTNPEPILPPYTNEHKELDKIVFLKIRDEVLPANNTISFLRYNNFAGFSFDNDATKDIEVFDSICDHDPSFEFIDPELEEVRKSLSDHISKFILSIGGNTFPSTGRANWNTVPPEWEIEQPERFTEVVDELHTLKNNICSDYDRLMQMGRRKLGV